MTNIVSAEFCCSVFKDQAACLAWLKDSDFHQLKRISDFKLRRAKSAVFLTNEKKRPVWRYQYDLHKYAIINQKRFEGVVIMIGDGPIEDSEIPKMLPENAAAVQEKIKLKEEKAEAARVLREQKKATLRKLKGESRGSVKDSTKVKRKRKTKKELEEEAYGIKMDPVNTH